MNKYTFNFSIKPALPAEYAVAVRPFGLLVAGTTLALKVTAEAADEQRLHEQAGKIAHNLARSLSY